MKALILAAGVSSRLYPISDKNLLEFNGKTLLEHQVENLEKAGFKEIIISVNKVNKDKISSIFKTKKIKIVEQKDLKEGQAGGVLAAEKYIKDSSFLIISGNDIVEKKLFGEIFKKAYKNKVDGLIIGREVENYFPGGYLKLNKKQVLEIIEKPGEKNTPSNFINLVIHFFKNSNDFLKLLKKYKNIKEGGYENALTKFCKTKNIEVLIYKNFWSPIKYPWDILNVNKFFLSKIKKNKISKKAQIHPSAIIENSVISDGVKVFENAIIKNSYIGKNSIVSNFSMTRDSNIGSNSVIGSFTEVARSFFASHVWTHRNYIGDSVIDKNVSFGAGTITGNLRLDEKEIYIRIKGEKINTKQNKIGVFCGKNVRCGISVNFMPGVKIGANTFISAGINVYKDLLKNSFIKKDNNFNIVENKNKDIKIR